MEPDAVHLWRVALDSPYDANILSPDEAQRAARYHFPYMRDRYSAGRCALRVILGRYLEVEPRSIAFTYNEHGKPLLGGRSQFNLSNAGDRMLLGVTEGRMIGVDLEKRDRRTQSDAVARRFFSAHEVEQFLAFPDDERGAAFLRGWVRKEAYLKAMGTGISGGLDNFTVSLADAAVTRMTQSDWCFYDVDMGSEFVASVALTTNPCRLETFDFPAGAIAFANVAGSFG